MYKRTTLFLFKVLLAANALSQTPNTLKLDTFFAALSKSHLAMGTVAISVDGRLRYQRSIGERFIGPDTSIAANAGTKYRIGSVSKLFTAVMILQLIEERRLKLSDRLAKFFPNLPNANLISIRDLLYHRSGLPDYTADFTDFEQWMDSTKSRSQLIELISDKKPQFNPGEKGKYTNSNYLVLGYIIESIDKCSYRESLNRRIIAKINLHNTNYATPIDTNKNEAVSYAYTNGQWIKQKETDTSIHQGAGMITSTPADLVKFIQALFENRLVKASSVRQMTTWMDNFGMGLFPNTLDSSKGAGHDGHIEGFSSSVQYYPKEKLAIAYCTNGEVYPKNDIMDILLRVCFNKRQPIPLFERIQLPDDILSTYVGRYTNKEFGIDVTVTSTDRSLQADVKGYNFNLEPIGKDEFIFRPMGFFFTFNPAKKKMLIKETFKSYLLQKVM